MVKNGAFSPKKSSIKNTSGDFLGMYELDFSCSLIFHQLWTHIGYFKGKKDQLIFYPFSAIFYRQADFQTLQQPPKSDSWGFHGGIPSSGTQGSPPKPFLEKKYFRPEIPNPPSQPSVHWYLSKPILLNSSFIRVSSAATTETKKQAFVLSRGLLLPSCIVRNRPSAPLRSKNACSPNRGGKLVWPLNK